MLFKSDQEFLKNFLSVHNSETCQWDLLLHIHICTQYNVVSFIPWKHSLSVLSNKVAIRHMQLFKFLKLKLKLNKIKNSFAVIHKLDCKCSIAACSWWLPYWPEQIQNISNVAEVSFIGQRCCRTSRKGNGFQLLADSSMELN